MPFPSTWQKQECIVLKLTWGSVYFSSILLMQFFEWEIAREACVTNNIFLVMHQAN